MSKINISFNDKNFEIDESVLASASTDLKQHLSTVMNGSGATIKFGGTEYSIDSVKLSTATNEFVSHLRTIAGEGEKITIGGIEFPIASTLIQNSLSDLCDHYTDLNNSSMAIPDSIEDLIGKYEFAYFSTFVNAVSAVNAGDISGYDADRETAIAGVYVDADRYHVVLLEDTAIEATIKPTVDMTINLGGHTLSSAVGTAFTINSGNIHFDARLAGSGINVKTPAGVNARAIAINSAAKVSIEGGILSAEGVGTTTPAILCLGTLNANNTTIIAKSATARTDGISLSTGASATINNCNISAHSAEGTANGVYVSKNCVVTITDSTMIGYSNYTHNGTSYTSSSMGVYQAAGSTLTLNNCTVRGTIAGMQTYGTLFVNGGTYEGYGHGGFYFTGSSAVAYVRNATIRECAFNEGYTTNNGTNEVGFYIGGGSNNSVYMDNCTIESAGHAIVLRTTSGEQNNTLYISNSNIGENQQIRIDSTTHKLYLGVGNNFTAEDTTLPAAVIETDETYVYNEMAV